MSLRSRLKTGCLGHPAFHYLSSIISEDCLPMQTALGTVCAQQLAVQPMHLATTAFWTLRSAAAFIASRVGISATHVLVQHSMWHMVQVRACLLPRHT